MKRACLIESGFVITIYVIKTPQLPNISFHWKIIKPWTYSIEFYAQIIFEMKIHTGYDSQLSKWTRKFLTKQNVNSTHDSTKFSFIQPNNKNRCTINPANKLLLLSLASVRTRNKNYAYKLSSRQNWCLRCTRYKNKIAHLS